jgi:hypothetical protein
VKCRHGTNGVYDVCCVPTALFAHPDVFMSVPGLQNSGNTCFFNGVLQVRADGIRLISAWERWLQGRLQMHVHPLQALASSPAILRGLQRVAAAAAEAHTAPPPLPDSLLQTLEALQPASGRARAVRCDELLAAVR